MKLKALLGALFLAGLLASFAVATPPPGKGNPHKATSSTSTSTSASPTTTSSDKKVTLCHRTGSKSNPWVKIRVSKNAVKAHMRNGDIALGTGGTCPTTPGPRGGTTSGATSTGTTTHA
jgi:hypothetical protein